MKPAAFSGRLSESGLQELLRRLGPSAGWMSWTTTKFLANLGAPQDLLDEGTAFNSTAEIRWKRVGPEEYRCLAFSDRGESFDPLVRLDEDWEIAEETVTMHVNPNAPEVSPPFSGYPAFADAEGRIRTVVLRRRDGYIHAGPRTFEKVAE